MASLEKAPPRDLHVQWNKNENVWEGDVAGYPSSLGGATLIRIAYAGPWAEIKYQAWLHLDATAVFDVTSEPAELIRYLQDPESDEFETITDPCVMFLVDNQRRVLQIDINAFSFDAAIAFELAQGNRDLIKDLLIQTCDKLDSPIIWSAIETIGHELIRRIGNDYSATISATEVEALIKRRLQ